ncbi:MAG: peptidase C11 [Eubacterium sp.]|nr:peptidase C11 [Eubacterium sp.]
MGVIIIIALVFFMMRSGACGGSYDSGSGQTAAGGSASAGGTAGASANTNAQAGSGSGAQAQTSGSSGFDLSSLFGGSYTGTTSASWEGGQANTGTLDTTVASGSREKRTKIVGNGKDQVTILIYMCGTDLESRSGMASRDLQEMANATLSDQVNVIVYTGGCARWQTSGISNSTNQIYRVKSGGMERLVDDMGNKVMTDPATLSEFIKWGKSNFPADRYELIFWDHGGGSNSGYGYDEKNARAGSMNLANISKALKDGGLTFDFIGFDACLMATVETGFVCEQYADYLIASEETEPGVGWYYTTWLTELSKNTSIPTLELGKIIIDSYTQACASGTPGQDTTLSLVDLAELVNTVPAKMTDFAKDTSSLIKSDEYQTVSTARSGTREFAASSRIDQVDLVHLAKKMGTDSGAELADAILGAVKYNQTSSRMANSYGVSIYFPYKKASGVDQMVNTYEAIGMDEDYTRCIQEFASMGVAGQVAAGGSEAGSPLGGLLGSLLGNAGSAYGTTSGSSQSASQASQAFGSSEAIAQLLGAFMGSDFSGITGLTSENTGFLGRTLDIDYASEYIAKHQFDGASLAWEMPDADGEGSLPYISLTKEQTEMIQDLDLSVFYDDGSGYVDLGMDNVFSFDDNGNLLAPEDRTWLAIDGQIVSYYRILSSGDEDDYTIMGRVPAKLNGDDVNLIVVFDSEHENGYVSGAVYDYVDGETDTIAKNLTELQAGDEIDFVCDFYDYDGNFQDRYYLGDTLVLEHGMDEMEIQNLDVGSGDIHAAYCFTDIYGQSYWSDFLVY